MAMGVPILDQDAVLKLPRERINNIHDVFPGGDLQGATGAEVILYVDNK